MQVIQAQLYPDRVTPLPWPSKQEEKDLGTGGGKDRQEGLQRPTCASFLLQNTPTHAKKKVVPRTVLRCYGQGVPGNLHLTVGPDRVRCAVHPVLRRGSISLIVILSGESHL